MSSLTIRHFVLCLGLLAVPPPDAFGTSVVALIIDNKSIVIGADGILIGNSRETKERVRVKYCKIRCVNTVCFAASGRYQNDSAGYDLFMVAERELQRRAGPVAAFNRVREEITPILPKLLAAAKKETPDSYADWLTGKPVVSFLFAGFTTENTPIIVSWQIRLNSSGHVAPEEEQFTRGNSRRIEGIAQGFNKNLDSFLKQNPGWNTSLSNLNNPLHAVRQLIQIEINASERAGRFDVGEPVAVVTLKPSVGFKLEAAGACKEQ